MAAAPTADFTPQELGRLRQALGERLQALEREIAADRDKASGDTTASAGVSDRKDEAARTAQAGVADAELALDLNEAAQVKAALERLAAGRYGRCSDCDAPIGRQRLAAQPAAARCLACQERAERRVR